MRQITDHKLNGLNESLEITADARTVQVLGGGSVTPVNQEGGASHEYTISLTNLAPGAKSSAYVLRFQNGAMAEVGGANGISNEALIAIVIDRLRGFQNSPFRCRENACALTKLEEALMWSQKRTRDRMARGVEGTHHV